LYGRLCSKVADLSREQPTQETGSFGSPPGDGIDGALSVLGEVLETFGGFEAKAPNDRQGCIS
jgi:hypothetical protein